MNLTSTTPPCYNNTTLGNCLYAWRKGTNVTNPICWTCKNCSYKCAADCEHCVIQCNIYKFYRICSHDLHFHAKFRHNRSNSCEVIASSKFSISRRSTIITHTRDHPRCVLGGLYHCTKFGSCRFSSFDNIVAIFVIWLEIAY